MYLSQTEVDKVCSVSKSRGTLFREVTTIEDLEESLEVNEAQECLKCGGPSWCQHMEAQKVNMKSLEEIENDLYWEGVLAEKNENRSL